MADEKTMNLLFDAFAAFTELGEEQAAIKMHEALEAFWVAKMASMLSDTGISPEARSMAGSELSESDD